MPLLEWREEFNTGDASVDFEHQELFNLINGLHGELTKSTRNRDEITDFLGDIYAQISSHFALEERLMRDKEYKDYPEHKADHDRLLDDIGDMMDDYDSERFKDLENDLSQRMQNWFTVHFGTMDAKLHALLGH